MTDRHRRALLQAEQQKQREKPGSSSAVQYVADTQAASASAVVTNTPFLATMTSEHHQDLTQTNDSLSVIQQYQPSNLLAFDSNRLLAAAAAQGSQILAGTLDKTNGEDQFDIWPLVDPLFQEGFHEVRRHSSCQYR